MKVDDEERQATRDLIGGLNLALRNVRAERDELRAEVRRLSAKLDAVPVAALRFCVDAADYTYDVEVRVAEEWLRTLEVPA